MLADRARISTSCACLHLKHDDVEEFLLDSVNPFVLQQARDKFYCAID